MLEEGHSRRCQSPSSAASRRIFVQELKPKEAARRHAKAAVTIPELEPQVERPWEGKFHARFASGGKHIVPIKAVLRLFPSMIEGRGRSLTFPVNGTDADRQFEITGARSGDHLMFDFWFASKIAHLPWVCDGKLNAAEDAIAGEWSMGCINMPECNCGGPSGPFELKRCR